MVVPRVLHLDPAFSTRPRVFHRTPRFPPDSAFSTPRDLVPRDPHPGTPAPRFPPSHIRSKFVPIFLFLIMFLSSFAFSVDNIFFAFKFYKPISQEWTI